MEDRDKGQSPVENKTWGKEKENQHKKRGPIRLDPKCLVWDYPHPVKDDLCSRIMHVLHERYRMSLLAFW